MRDDLLFEENNYFVSKTLKQIDSNVCYKKENQTKLIKNLQESNKEKNREFLAKNKQIHQEIIKKKNEKIEEIKRREISRNNIHHLNLLSSPYNIQFLPKISPFIKNVNNILIMDNKKAEKIGSKGFDYIWKQEKLLKLSGIRPDEILNKDDDYKQNKYRSTHMHNINDESDDIFDSNYNERKKKSEKYLELKERLKRIINQNQKVNTKCNLHREKVQKFKVKKIYYPKYESIEKHKPEILLYNKTRRLFPDNLMQKSYYKENRILCHSNKNLNMKKIRNKRKTFSICSSFSMNDILSKSILKSGANMKLSNITFYDINKSRTMNHSSMKKINYNNNKLMKSKAQNNLIL